MIKLWSPDIYVLILFENKRQHPVLRISKQPLLSMCQWLVTVSGVAVLDFCTQFLQNKVWAFSFYPVQLPKHLPAEAGWIWASWESSVPVLWAPCLPWRWWMDSWRSFSYTSRTLRAVGAWLTLLGHLWGPEEQTNRTEYAKFYFLCRAVVKVVWKMEGAAVYGDCWLCSQHVSNQS